MMPETSLREAVAYCASIRKMKYSTGAQCKVPDFNSTEAVRPCSRHIVVFGAEDEKYYAIDYHGTLV